MEIPLPHRIRTPSPSQRSGVRNVVGAEEMLRPRELLDAPLGDFGIGDGQRPRHNHSQKRCTAGIHQHVFREQSPGTRHPLPIGLNRGSDGRHERLVRRPWRRRPPHKLSGPPLLQHRTLNSPFTWALKATWARFWSFPLARKDFVQERFGALMSRILEELLRSSSLHYPAPIH